MYSKLLLPMRLGKPYSKVSTVEITFTNTAADISNVVANLKKIGPGVFSVT